MKNDMHTYPVRINKYLADEGYTTRRKADEFIKQGFVTINGKTAVLGDKVHEGDTVVFSRAKRKELEKHRYYALYNKPAGVQTEDVMITLKRRGETFELFPIGRLDKASHGLLLFTNDGRVTQPLLHPQFYHEKTYRVRVDTALKPRVARIFARGMDLEGDRVRPVKMTQLSNTTCELVLTEGKKHQIRRMFAALGYRVLDLERTKILFFDVGGIKAGTYRLLSKEEVDRLLEALSL